MAGFDDLKNFFKDRGYNVIIAADAQTRNHETEKNEIVLKTPAGGVSVAFDALARASSATYIARGKTSEDKKMVDSRGKVMLEDPEGAYTLKRLFLTDEELEKYYYGFSNQTLWPLCHVAFEKPIFNKEWYEGYKAVNKQFAQAIKEEIKGKTFVWINDYQLSLVPAYLGKRKDVVVGMFWHIPWPTWEVFRVLPQQKDILWSLLSCDFLAFHRRYQVRNFLDTVDRELEVRIEDERGRVYFDKNVLTVASLPMGLDTDVIRSLVTPQESFLSDIIQQALGMHEEKEPEKKSSLIDEFFKKYQVILGIDRLDYTKGIPQRLAAIDRFLEQNPRYIGKVLYLGIMAPSRDKIPSYKALKLQIEETAKAINKKYQRGSWKPLYLAYESFDRDDIINFYKQATLCLVTPLDDGMNLVSKEFVIATSLSSEPGMLILSQFAGSAIDLASALIINPYDHDAVANAIKRGLEMPKKEKVERVKQMVSQLDEHNIYEWARSFARGTFDAAQVNREREL